MNKIRIFLKRFKKAIDKKKIQCLVWDFDGTFYQSKLIEDELKAAYLSYLRDNKINISNQGFDALAGNIGSWGKTTALLLNLSEIEVLDAIDLRFDISQYLEKNSDLVNFISSLSTYEHLILSNASQNYIRSGLKKLGFRPNQKDSTYPFKEIFSRDETKVLKPHKEAFLKVLNYTNLKPSQHLVIGDSYHHDLKPARDLGMQAIFINSAKKYLQNL